MYESHSPLISSHPEIWAGFRDPSISWAIFAALLTIISLAMLVQVHVLVSRGSADLEEAQERLNVIQSDVDYTASICDKAIRVCGK